MLVEQSTYEVHALIREMKEERKKEREEEVV